MALKTAKSELRRLWDDRDSNVCVGVDGPTLRQCFGSTTNWGKELSEDKQWNDLAAYVEQWNTQHVFDQMDEFNAEEEVELKARLGGYYVSACGLGNGPNDLTGGSSAATGGGRNAILNEIESRLDRVLPSVGEVRRRLGDETAEQYRCDVESLQDRGWTVNMRKDNPSAPQNTQIKVTRKTGRAQELREIAQLVSMAAMPNPDDRIEAYVQMVEAKKKFRRERRIELKERNKAALRKARSLNIWFAYHKDSGKWLNDSSTAKFAPVFLALVHEARKRLAPRRRVLQYVPKRRLTRRAARELPLNMANLIAFLEDENCLEDHTVTSTSNESSTSSTQECHHS
jgi:hypothetical protein